MEEAGSEFCCLLFKDSFQENTALLRESTAKDQRLGGKIWYSLQDQEN